MITPIASETMGISKLLGSNTAKRIIKQLNSTGENEGAKKCFKEFKIPIDSAVREIKIIYGNIILFSSTARSNTSALKPEAKIFTI